MTFHDAVSRAHVVLAEGAVIERLRRDPAVTLDPHVLNLALLNDEDGRRRLARIYRQYLDIGQAYDLPMLVLTPTWRTNPERVRAAGLADRDVNADAARFMMAVRSSYGPYASRVYVGGLLGPRGDAYRPAEALATDDVYAFHRPQAAALAAAGVDFLLAATLPAVTEALGLARALAACNYPYVLSFIIRPDGTCIDGTPLHEAIRRIDGEAKPPPTAYFVNCVHPAVFAAALEAARARDPQACKRVGGLQANTSLLSPEELDGRPDLDSASPDDFAAAMLDLHHRFGVRILGGCCGTDDRHIAALARQVAPLSDR